MTQRTCNTVVAIADFGRDNPELCESCRSEKR